MKGAWTIAMREIGERRSVLLAALVAGLFPFASPLFPGVRSDQWAEARDVAALVVAAAFGLGCALLLGATAIGRDLSERRLSFDFARPLGSGGIWAGRLFGALGLSILALGLALLPATAVGGGLLSGPSVDSVRGLALVVVVGMLAVVALAHVASVAVRSRTGWLVVDLACAVAWALLLIGSGRLLEQGFALRLLAVAGITLGSLTILALWTASAAQVVCGRTDLRRGHKAQSLTLWGILLPSGVLFASFVAWVVSATPADLVGAQVAGAAPRGSWLAVGGQAWGRGDYHPAFLLDTATGRSVRLGTALWGTSIEFAGNGRRALLVRPEGRQRLFQIALVDLDRPDEGVRDTSVFLPDARFDMALSEAGDRLAVLSEGTLSVFDLDSGATLAAVRSVQHVQETFPRLFFAAPDRVRLVVLGPRVTIDELDVAEKTLRRIGEFEQIGEGFQSIRWHPGRERYLIHGWGEGARARLIDGRTGEGLREWRCDAEARCAYRFLADGRIVVMEHAPGRGALRLLSAEGDAIRVIETPNHGWPFPAGEITAGQMIVQLQRAEKGATGRRTFRVDLDRGTWVELADDLTPNAAAYAWHEVRTPEAGNLGSRLFASKGAVFLVDPVSGDRTRIVGRE